MANLTITYYKNFMYSNFFNINKNWLFNKSSNLNHILILLESTPKFYNQKKFLISLMLLEYLLKSKTVSFKTSIVYNRPLIKKKKISMGYWIKNNNMLIFLDSLSSHILWTVCKQIKGLKFLLDFDLRKNKIIKYVINRMLESIFLVKNKIQFERYLLKKVYNFKICFLGYNYIYYLWWMKVYGFPSIK